MIKHIIISVASAIVVVAGFFGYSSATAQPVQAPVTHNVKGISGDFSNVNVLNVNGISEYYYTSQFRAGTTTLCSFPAPAGSSTIQFANFKNTTASSSSQVISMGTSTVSTGTSSALVSAFTIPANGTTSNYGFVASSYPGASFSSGQFLNIVSDSLTTVSGTCQLEVTID